ncbi:MAG: hypothetical protein ACPGID_00230 [Rubricella sp.]
MLLFFLASPLAAQENDSRFAIGQDRFLAGMTAILVDEDVDDAFIAAEYARVARPVAGSVHIAGRTIEIDGETGADLYVAGQTIDIRRAVQGDATLAGYEINVTAPVGGDLRAGAARLAMTADVSGSATIAAETLFLDGTIAGDMAIAARAVSFGPGARIEGNLRLYESVPGETTIPADVIPEARITRIEIDRFEREEGPVINPAMIVRTVVLGTLAGILFTGLVATIAIAMAPETIAGWRRAALARPGSTILTGFAALALLIGGGLLFGATIVGILIMPFLFLVAGLLAYLGYVLGAYILGVGIWMAFGREEPGTLPLKFALACLGALVVALTLVIPLLGWLFTLGITVLGVGAMTARLMAGAFARERGV